VDAEPTALGAREALDLLDWKRRMFALYAEIRAEKAPESAWRRWRAVRERLFREHPQSPLPSELRPDYHGKYFDYDPAFRVVADVADATPIRTQTPASAGGQFAFTRVGLARFTLLGSGHELELLWNESYGGGVLVTVADTTSGRETYGGGRYVLDTVKGADLGEHDGGIVLDFNFAYNPSCAYDARWACPLASAANRLPLRVEAGEKTPFA
jgi:uncharacterized protein (DUF1684 family)